MTNELELCSTAARRTISTPLLQHRESQKRYRLCSENMRRAVLPVLILPVLGSAMLTTGIYLMVTNLCRVGDQACVPKNEGAGHLGEFLMMAGASALIYSCGTRLCRKAPEASAPGSGPPGAGV